MRTLTTNFVQRFCNIAAETPDAPAVCEHGKIAYTYGQLFEAASSLASQLRARGIGKEDVVGIHVEKSAQYIAAMVGTWFAGAAFVPLDPRLPAERIAYLVEQARVTTLIGRYSSVPPTGSAQSRSGAGADQNAIRAFSSQVQIADDDLAYIIFTSGSTGEPKGVMVTHRGILPFLDAQIEGFKIKSNSRCLFYLSTNFDASVSDIGTALLAGAALYIETEEALKPGPEFYQILRERGITHMDIPPSILAMLHPDEVSSSVETIIIGGEACALNVVREWATRVNLVNVYGPTEATVCTSFGRCGDDWSVPLIGKPIRGTFYRVLDDDRSPVQEGDSGELYISGAGLARGYLNKPELTASKFVEVDGRRCYRTGDHVRLLADGEIEFLGRTDRQFKLRGLLIEPEEIERRLREHPTVKNAAALKRPLSQRAKRDALVAFVQCDVSNRMPHLVSESGHAIRDSLHSAVHESGGTFVPSSVHDSEQAARESVRSSTGNAIGDPVSDAIREQLRAYLAERLPKWMIPQHIELVSEFEKTLTGKIDYSKLKGARLSRGHRRGAAVNADEVVMSIAAVWSEVLGLDEVGPDENFFDLGGDSFAVIEAAAAAEARGFKIPPALLMQYPVLKELAAKIKASPNAFSNDDIESAGGMTCDEIRSRVAFNAEFETLIDDAAGRYQSRSQAVRDQMRNVLFTGATGFLGARLLLDLLRSTDATFFCIVRAGSDEEAAERIKAAFAKQYLKVDDTLLARVVPIRGDLQQVRFGLEEPVWNRLCADVDTVFHNAAVVNMLSSFEQLRRANVDTTLEVIRFLATERPKTLHYASTLSVFVATDQNTGVAYERDDLSKTNVVYGGYAQTKWASEILLRRIDGVIAPVSFYRLGLITCDTESGAMSEHDFLAMFIRGIAKIGCVPDTDLSISLDVSPINYAFAAMSQIACKLDRAETNSDNNEPGAAIDATHQQVGIPDAAFRTFHVANSSSLSLEQIVSLMRESGTEINVVSAEEFLKAAKAKEAEDPCVSSAALALCRVLKDEKSFESNRTMDLFQATNIRFDTRNTEKVLGGFQMPTPVKAAHRYFSK